MPSAEKPAPRRSDRLFFAVFPDAAVAESMARVAHDLSERYGGTGKPLAPDRLHLSLLHVGDFAGLPTEGVAAAERAAAAVDLLCFEVCCNHLVSFSGKGGRRGLSRPIVLAASEGTDALQALRNALMPAMSENLLPREAKKSFIPHMTLLYDQRGYPKEVIESPRWMVRAFVLIHSLIGRTQYRVLGRWPLRS